MTNISIRILIPTSFPYIPKKATRSYYSSLRQKREKEYKKQGVNLTEHGEIKAKQKETTNV